MKRLLQRANKKVDSAELFKIKSKTIPVNFEVNKLKSIDISEQEGIALRIINKGKLGFSSSSGKGNFGLMLEKAIASAEYGAIASFTFPSNREAKKKRSLEIYDEKVKNKSVEEMVEMGENLINQLKDFHQHLRIDVTILKNYSQIEYINSQGGSFNYYKTAFSCSIVAQKIETKDILMVYNSFSSGKDSLDIEELISEIKENLQWGEKIVPINSGRMPVIFTPKAVLTLILPVLSGLNGKMVYQRISPLANQQGNKLWSELFTLYNDGTIDFALGSAPFDDEGIEMRRFPLVEKGVVKNFYYDLQTAGLTGVESTGNGLRPGIENEPIPKINNLIIEEGKVPFPEMIKDIREGIIIDQVLGLGQGNILSGAFSNNVQLGFKIEKGKVVGRVKDVMIAGNALVELKNIIAIGERAKWIEGQFKFPHLYLKDLSVSTKAN